MEGDQRGTRKSERNALLSGKVNHTLQIQGRGISESTGPSTAGDEYAALGNDDFSFLITGELKKERLKILQRDEAIQHGVSKIKKFWFATIDKDEFRELLQDIGNLIEKLNELRSDRILDELQESSQLQQLLWFPR